MLGSTVWYYTRVLQHQYRRSGIEIVQYSRLFHFSTSQANLLHMEVLPSVTKVQYLLPIHYSNRTSCVPWSLQEVPYCLLQNTYEKSMSNDTGIYLNAQTKRWFPFKQLQYSLESCKQPYSFERKEVRSLQGIPRPQDDSQINLKL